MKKQQIDAVIFDWGNTIMRDFPEYSGSMVDWPRVEVIDGVRETLEHLHGCYQIALATNAAESGETLVWAALRRVGLDVHFLSVFAAREIGKSKPDPAFFHTVLDALGVPPENAIMVGDHYSGDIAGAKNAGLSAVWFNPSGSACPGCNPLADAEILHLQELPAVINSRMLPDVQTCLAWLAEQRASPQLLNHVRMVGATAYLLAVWLRYVGEIVNPILTHRGGLLHDLDKITSRELDMQHGELSYRLLLEKDQVELGEIARRHLMFTILDPTLGPRSWEEKLVYYADKIVEQDEIVGVTDRLNALQNRYPQYAEQIKECQPFITDLEGDICGCLDVRPRDLYASLRNDLFA